VRVRSSLASAALLVLASLILAPTLPAAAGAEIENPCTAPGAGALLCPNLRIARPSELYLDRTGSGRALLRATSDVRSRGRGPMELRGRRDGPRSMRTNQRIYRAGGGHITVPTHASLRFTYVGTYFGGSYWKVHQLARFDLRPVRAGGELGDPVRTSPKLNYCLRDLTHTRPGRRSPFHWVYPGCNQNPFQDRVTLGTSVGWSDIYPAAYHQQWIDVTGLRGCFAYQMTVDPTEALFESNEDDNTSQVLVHLPFRGRTGC
jgi:hypothetical protein